MPVDKQVLLSIITNARAGALDHARFLFEQAGLAAIVDDAAVLSVKGRLLKDMAGRMAGTARLQLYADAAQAYRQAADAGGGTYPLINAATLSLLCGAEATSRMLAGEALARVAAHPDEPETPYYRAATRAEALVLLGRKEEAQAALGEAVALAPLAWEDHASTLRQFAIILDALGQDSAWLDMLRPPRSLHFGGHMAFRAHSGATALTHNVAAALEDERIGFGYGALAAGADIIIAEALLDRGATLHVILPGGVAGFAALSVDPWGSEWRRRFDAVLARAETVRTVEPRTVPDETMIALADEIAMGSALANARLLASEAVQLLVLADDGESPVDSASGRARTVWSRAGHRQKILSAPREIVDGPAAAEGTSRYRTAVLAIRAPGSGEGGLAAIKAALDRCPTPDVAATFTGNEVVLAYDDLALAVQAGLIVKGETLRIGGHYGIADRVNDPFAGSLRLIGRPVDLACAAAASAPAGTICVTDDFASALTIIAPDASRAEYVGELASPAGESPVGLFALRSPDQVQS
ncbi:MAG: hypothetical protein P0Y59_15240 [Candidatus Sphingomonas phytovorans]|nr:tetratricopeptide repeat-containing protein [Sphingomonas sp.]WEJ98298.1 MAG: hypothetical protein P0Y59_15240 [Sphingomonas sp.]